MMGPWFQSSARAAFLVSSSAMKRRKEASAPVSRTLVAALAAFMGATALAAACGGNAPGHIPCDKGAWGTNATILDQVALSETYTGYTSVSGDVLVRSPEIADLDPLACLETVGGMLAINENPLLSNVEGLSSLTEVGGTLVIQTNASLASLAGLESLAAIGTGSGGGAKSLQVYDNAALETLDGLSGLVTVTENLYIYDNPELRSLGGLSSLTTLGGVTLLITGNPKLPMCEAYAFRDRMIEAGFRGEAIIAGNDYVTTCE